MPETRAIDHVVLVRWGPGTTPAAVEEIRAAVRTLPASVPGIESLSEGPSVSPEQLEGGFEYGIVIRFADEGARDAYLPHSAHVPVADALRRRAQHLVVFDTLA